MNIIQIEYFMDLVETKSFRKTADNMYISQPAVSKQISLLEQEFGFRLFERAYRNVTLTPYGQIMYDYFKEASDSFQAAFAKAKELKKNEGGEIRFGMMEEADVGNLFVLISEFRTENPDVQLTIERVPPSQLMIDVDAPKYDIIMNQDIHVRNRNLVETIPVCRREFIALISEQNPLSKKKDLCFEDLKNLTLYVPALTEDSSMITVAQYICGKHGMMPMKTKIVPNISSLVAELKTGSGMGVLDTSIPIPTNGLRIIPTEDEFNVVLAWNKMNVNNNVKRFVAYIRENYKDSL